MHQNAGLLAPATRRPPPGAARKSRSKPHAPEGCTALPPRRPARVRGARISQTRPHAPGCRTASSPPRPSAASRTSFGNQDPIHHERQPPSHASGHRHQRPNLIHRATRRWRDSPSRTRGCHFNLAATPRPAPPPPTPDDTAPRTHYLPIGAPRLLPDCLNPTTGDRQPTTGP